MNYKLKHKNSGEVIDVTTPNYGKHTSNYGYLTVSNNRVLFFTMQLEELEVEDLTDQYEILKDENVRTYTIIDDGENLIRTNDGFTAMELLGMLEFTQKDIINQIKGNIEPDKIVRNVVVD